MSALYNQKTDLYLSAGEGYLFCSSAHTSGIIVIIAIIARS
jgi:hypothetical protein